MDKKITLRSVVAKIRDKSLQDHEGNIHDHALDIFSNLSDKEKLVFIEDVVNIFSIAEVRKQHDKSSTIYIKDDVLAVYYNLEEFVIPFDRNLVREKGIDAMIGLVLKTVKDQYQERQDKIEEEKKAMLETKKEANPDLVHLNPGAVTYEDLKAYMEKKRAGRI